MRSTTMTTAMTASSRRSRSESCSSHCASPAAESGPRKGLPRAFMGAASWTLSADLHAPLVNVADRVPADEVRLPAVVAQLLAEAVEACGIGRVQRHLESAVVKVERLHARARSRRACLGERLQGAEQAIRSTAPAPSAAAAPPPCRPRAVR